MPSSQPFAGRGLKDYLNRGVVLIDKPCGPSSHEVAAFARNILGLPKTGHTGTLDQDVSGVLVILLGEACKLVSFFPDSDKKYVCIMHLEKEVSRQDLEKAFDNFRGKIYQTPPLEAAVARRLRIREIYSLKILEVAGRDVLFECDCEAGTYIRKLCFDAGEVLGVPAEMKELRRTKAMGFDEADAITLQDLADYYWLATEKKDESRLRKAVMPIERALALKPVELSAPLVSKLKNGLAPSLNEVGPKEKFSEGEFVKFLDSQGNMLGIGSVTGGGLKIERLLSF